MELSIRLQSLLRDKSQSHVNLRLKKALEHIGAGQPVNGTMSNWCSTTAYTPSFSLYARF